MNVEAATLTVAIRELLSQRGLPRNQAQDVAIALVETSLDGIDTHGVRLLKTYLLELEGGRAVKIPNMRVHGNLPAACVLDADNALGAVAMSEAMRIASARAAKYGIAAVAVSNSNHFGAAGHYARLAAAYGQIGLVFSNSDALVVPYGGSTPLNGTNPLAVTAPGVDGDDFNFDMATSHSSFTRVSHALDTGAAVDGDALQGSHLAISSQHSVPILQPLGGMKGQGLAMMIQILCAMLAGMPYDSELSHLYTPPYDAPRKISHFAIAIQIGGFVPVETFETRVTLLHQRFRDSTSTGELSVCVPGDRERASRAARTKDGIPIDADLQSLLHPWIAPCMPA